MIRAALISMALATPALGAGDVLPSGLMAGAPDIVVDASALRMRYVIAEIADTDSYPFDLLEADFQWLCDQFGVAAHAQSAPDAPAIIISFAAQPLAFGETAPNVVQYFEAFRVEDDACIWEGL